MAHPYSDGFNFAVAVFAVASSGQYVLVCLDEDANESAAADAVARGYTFAGSIAVVDGVPRVQIEPGFEAVVPAAGVGFAELLGVRLQRHQLAAKACASRRAN